MARKGFSVALLKRMLKMSALRKRRGVFRNQPQGNRGRRPNPQGGRGALNRHRRRIVGVVNQAILALQTENAALWVRLHSPRNPRRYRSLFWRYLEGIQSRRIALHSYTPPQISFQKHPRLGLVAYYYFRMRVGRQVSKRYWQLFYSNGRWLLF